MILAICNSSQYEVAAFNAVKSYIEQRGIEYVSYFQDKCLQGNYLSFASDENSQEFYITIGKRNYDINAFSSIWMLKPMLPKKLMRYQPHEYAHFMQIQFATMRKGLGIVFRDKQWLNDPLAMEKAESKILQLQIARSVGFKLPKTLISSDPSAIRRFFRANKRTIIKTLNPTIIPDYVIFTSELSEEHMLQINSAKYAPAIYQELIEKKFELRVTVVDKTIFAAKIYSQDDDYTSLDWRVDPKLNDYNVRMEPFTISKPVEKKIFELMSLLGLQFGCIDLIVTSEDEIVFLEINPNGQWYFVQLNTGLEIAKSISEVLCKPL